MTDQTATTSPPPSATSSPPPPPPQPLLLPNLPDDVALQCIARLPRSHHPTLSLVSKSWRSTVRSDALFTTRSLLGSAQHFLYLSLRVDSSFTWYLLDPIPRNPRKALSPLPPIPSHPIGSAFAVLGPKVYVIGGSIGENPTNKVWVFDCRINEWGIGPEMRVRREFAAAEAVNGKIYVIGGCLVDNWARSESWAEVFDPVTGFWSPVPSPIENRDKWMHASAVIYDKIYAMADRGGVVYDVAAAQWDRVSTRLDNGWRGQAAVVEGILYCYDYLGKIRGYDVKENRWKELKGVEKGLPKFLCGATMADLGGRLCVVWEGQKWSGKEVEIMCAEIDVWKEDGGGLCGSIVWSDMVLVVPNRSTVAHCVAVGL